MSWFDSILCDMMLLPYIKVKACQCYTYNNRASNSNLYEGNKGMLKCIQRPQLEERSPCAPYKTVFSTINLLFLLLKYKSVKKLM